MYLKLLLTALATFNYIISVQCDNSDVLIDAKATLYHRIDSLNLLIYCEWKFLCKLYCF